MVVDTTVGVYDLVGASEHELVTGERSGVAYLVELQLGLTKIGVARSESDSDKNDAQVHDHAAVGPAHKAAPALTPRGEHELAKCGSASETGESKGEHRRKATAAKNQSHNHGNHAEDRWPKEAVAKNFASGLTPWQYRGDRHEE